MPSKNTFRFLILTFIAWCIFLYCTNDLIHKPQVPSETDYNQYKIEGCKAVVQELYFETKLIPVYRDDAYAWCDQNYRLNNE